MIEEKINSDNGKLLMTRFINKMSYKIKMAIHNQGLTITDMSVKTGLSTRAIYYAINGQRNSIETLLLILDALDMDLKIRAREGSVKP